MIYVEGENEKHVAKRRKLHSIQKIIIIRNMKMVTSFLATDNEGFSRCSMAQNHRETSTKQSRISATGTLKVFRRKKHT